MKKYFLSLAVIMAIILMWYLFIRSYEYKISFNVKTYPGTIAQTIKLWNSSLGDAKITSQKSDNSIEQQVIIANHQYIYNWEIELMNDSTSKVEVNISELNNRLINKITIPFIETEIEKTSQKVVKDFYEIIKKHLDNINVKVEGVSEFERTYCVYVPVKTTQIGKANGMMRYYPLISSFIVDHNIESYGFPIIEITNWNRTEDSLEYNFCFPIIKTDTLPSHHVLKYKWLESTKALKAVYNGNYITSDRAWYSLMNYAEKNGIETANKPIERFYHNPNFGNNEKEWKADIFLPIK